MTRLEWYKSLVEELYSARRLAGGSLPLKKEMDWASRIAEVWNGLSSEEKREIDTLVEAADPIAAKKP